MKIERSHAYNMTIDLLIERNVRFI